jgi:predicted acetyltransferase
VNASDAGLQLIRPTTRLRDSYLAALAEHQAQGRFLDNRHMENDPHVLRRDFGAFVAALVGAEDPRNVRPGFVPETFFWLVDAADEVVGRASIRHALSEEPTLRDIGHIGYDIRPSRQGRGYGSAILGLTLAEARRLRMPRVLVTCDAINRKSKAIIEHWGGVLETTVPLPGRSYGRLCYWIDL